MTGFEAEDDCVRAIAKTAIRVDKRSEIPFMKYLLNGFVSPSLLAQGGCQFCCQRNESQNSLALLERSPGILFLGSSILAMRMAFANVSQRWVTAAKGTG